MEERPRILIKHDEKRTGRAASPEKKPESPLEGMEKSSVGSFHRTLSSSSDPPGSAGETTRHRVTFADDVMETVGDKDETNIQAPQGSSRRAPLQKIMLRKMGEKDGDPATEKGKEAGPTGQGGSGRGGPKAGDQDVAAAESTKPKTAWSSNERGPIISPKTLYEPEGKQSVAKFKKYHAQTRETPGSRGSHDLATPTSEGGTTPTGDRPDGGNRREETSSPIDRASQSSPSGKERRPSDYRKGGRKGEREKPPFQDRDSHDHHNRPHHRKENSRRERDGEGEHGEGPPAARTTRPAAVERLASTENEEGGREEHEHHHYEPRGKGHSPSRREQPHHQDRPPLLGTA